MVETKRRRKSLQCLLFLAMVSLVASQTMEEKIDDFVASVMQCADIPGIMLTVVKDGQVSMA